MTYKLVNDEQQEFLKSLAVALGLKMDDLFNVQYIAELKEKVEKLEADLKERDQLLADITKQLLEIKTYLLNMQNEEIVKAIYE